MLVLSACGGGAGGGSSSETASSETGATESANGDPASELTGEFSTLAGGQIDLASLQGQDTVLWFWAPW